MPRLREIEQVCIESSTPTVSVVDLVASVNKPVSVDAVNGAIESSPREIKGILDISLQTLGIHGLQGDEESAVVDGLSTLVIGDNLVKVVAWYDNEWGYCERLVDLIDYVAKKGEPVE